MFTNIPFRVDYPLEIFHPTKRINFVDNEERETLFQRNIYSYLFDKKRNNILERKNETFLSLNERVLDYMGTNYPSLEVLSTSLFGSSLFLENPEDYDFLVITNGDVCLLDEFTLNLSGKDIQTGISIKGVDNYLRGFKNPQNIKDNPLEQVIDRTTISLFRRHLPISGKDFLSNNQQFLKNTYAQVSDLIHNSHRLFYLENDKGIKEDKRARKILNRCYEATSYMGVIDPSVEIDDIRKKIYFAIANKVSLKKSKAIFDEFTSLYEEKVSKIHYARQGHRTLLDSYIMF